MIQEITATVKCPRCGKGGLIKIPKEKFETVSEGGLMKIAMDHGDHIFVVWIDSYGYQRATDVFETLKESLDLRERELGIMDIINVYGIEFFSKILTASICGFRMYIEVDKKYLKFLDYLITYLLREFPNVVDNPQRAEIVISIGSKTPKLPGEEYFYNVLNEMKKIDNEKLQVLKLKLAMETVKQVSDKIKRKILGRKAPISIIDLAKDVKVKDKSLLILAINRVLYSNRELRRFIKEKTHIFSS